ncbi:helix-turn-helix domain-containing protein [Chryseobacterium sp. 52]|uniref:helix-turn-helix domain-containing protein n=1 Tax=Chryseobacterium sp. 52 TaxID=2035213 RepID=UPI001E4B4E9E|nr:AraC family transcriptional regulator [Chryseobacterium sp. 52]
MGLLYLNLLANGLGNHISFGKSTFLFSKLKVSLTGENFTHKINQYRVEVIKEMISNSEYESCHLLAMGLEAGFTSKAVFYKAFKKVAGQTPNEYKNTSK